MLVLLFALALTNIQLLMVVPYVQFDFKTLIKVRLFEDLNSYHKIAHKNAYGNLLLPPERLLKIQSTEILRTGVCMK